MRGPQANPVRVVDHPIRLDRVELAVRPWRTATLVVAAVAAVELVLLVMIGGALLAKPEPAARKAAPHRSATAVVKKAPKPIAPAASKASGAELPRRKVTVVVLNGNGRQGAAAAAASRVTREGLPHRPRRQRSEPRLRDVARHVPPRLRGRGAAARTRPRREGRQPARRRPAEPAPRRARRSDPRRLEARCAMAPPWGRLRPSQVGSASAAQAGRLRKGAETAWRRA